MRLSKLNLISALMLGTLAAGAVSAQEQLVPPGYIGNPARDRANPIRHPFNGIAARREALELYGVLANEPSPLSLGAEHGRPDLPESNEATEQSGGESTSDDNYLDDDAASGYGFSPPRRDAEVDVYAELRRNRRDSRRAHMGRRLARDRADASTGYGRIRAELRRRFQPRTHPVDLGGTPVDEGARERTLDGNYLDDDAPSGYGFSPPRRDAEVEEESPYERFTGHRAGSGRRNRPERNPVASDSAQTDQEVGISAPQNVVQEPASSDPTAAEPTGGMRNVAPDEPDLADGQAVRGF